jgi:hypothetical protein
LKRPGGFCPETNGSAEVCEWVRLGKKAWNCMAENERAVIDSVFEQRKRERKKNKKRLFAKTKPSVRVPICGRLPVLPCLPTTAYRPCSDKGHRGRGTAAAAEEDEELEAREQTGIRVVVVVVVVVVKKSISYQNWKRSSTRRVREDGRAG